MLLVVPLVVLSTLCRILCTTKIACSPSPLLVLTVAFIRSLADTRKPPDVDYRRETTAASKEED